MRCGAVRICGPTKAALWLVESGPQIAVSQQDAWASGLHTGNDRYIHYALGIWQIYRAPVGFPGSPAGPLNLADPLFHRCSFADLVRIDGGPVDRSGESTADPLDFADLLRASSISRIHCGPVGSCGSTVLHVFADLLLRDCIYIGPRGSTADLLRARWILWIYCGPVQSRGSTAGRLDLADPLFYMCLRIYCCGTVYI